ncbi:ferredoxin [Kocuria rhizophila]|nr:ferredoxin [Kocuria rhizophila]
MTDRDGVRTEGVEWKDFESLMECLTRNKFPSWPRAAATPRAPRAARPFDQETFVKTGGARRGGGRPPGDAGRHPSRQLPPDLPGGSGPRTSDGAEIEIAPEW